MNVTELILVVIGILIVIRLMFSETFWFTIFDLMYDIPRLPIYFIRWVIKKRCKHSWNTYHVTGFSSYSTYCTKCGKDKK